MSVYVTSWDACHSLSLHAIPQDAISHPDVLKCHVTVCNCMECHVMEGSRLDRISHCSLLSCISSLWYFFFLHSVRKTLHRQPNFIEWNTIQGPVHPHRHVIKGGFSALGSFPFSIYNWSESCSGSQTPSQFALRHYNHKQLLLLKSRLHFCLANTGRHLSAMWIPLLPGQRINL